MDVCGSWSVGLLNSFSCHTGRDTKSSIRPWFLAFCNQLLWSTDWLVWAFHGHRVWVLYSNQLLHLRIRRFVDSARCLGIHYLTYSLGPRQTGVFETSDSTCALSGIGQLSAYIESPVENRNQMQSNGFHMYLRNQTRRQDRECPDHRVWGRWVQVWIYLVKFKYYYGHVAPSGIFGNRNVDREEGKGLGYF